MATEIEVTVQGTSPLLMNRFRDASIEGDSKKNTGAKKVDDIRDKLYLVDDVPHLPAVYFRNTLVEAAKQFNIRGKGKSTYSKLVGSTVEVQPELFEILGAWTRYSVAAVNPATKGRMMTHRPRFDKWTATFRLVLNDDGIPEAVAKEILDHAGRYTGVGDWRPEKKGMFGKFQIVQWRVV